LTWLVRSAYETVSTPAPPIRVSSPRPPCRMSLPLPPSIRSLCELPIRVSSPSLPLSVHLTVGTVAWSLHGAQYADSVSPPLPPASVRPPRLPRSPPPVAPSSGVHPERAGTVAPAWRVASVASHGAYEPVRVVVHDVTALL